MEKYKRKMDYIQKNNPWLLKGLKRFKTYIYIYIYMYVCMYVCMYTHTQKTKKYKRKMCYHQKNNLDVKTFKRLKNIKES